MSRRDQIKMTEAEVEAFLEEQRTMSIATIGRDGRPHVIAMWYAFLDGIPSFWTFAKSQKVREPAARPADHLHGRGRRNLRPAPRRGAGRAGGDHRGRRRKCSGSVSLEFERYQNTKVTDALMPQVRMMANKRVVVKIHTERVVSWDHRKLGGTY